MSLARSVLAVVLATAAGFAQTEAYRLGPGDTISVQAREVEELVERKYRIDAHGHVNLPVVGQIQASGRSVADIEREVKGRLEEFYHRPAVTVTLSETQNRPVSVLGWVNRPGVYQLTGPKTLLEVLSEAGGIRVDAGATLYVTRRAGGAGLPLPSVKQESGGILTGEVSVRDILEGRSAAMQFEVQPHDVITVPKGEMVYVMGDVTKPGGFVLDYHEKITVLRALALSAGLLRTASPRRARILRRIEAGGEKQEIALDLQKILDGKLPDVELSTDDILFVPSSLAKRATLRTIESAVQAGTGIAIWRGAR